MLNLGIKNTQPMMKYNLKEKIDNIISQLNNFSINISNYDVNNMIIIPKYNIRFTNTQGRSDLIVADENLTVMDMINKYLIKIGRDDLIVKEDKEYDFLYNSKKINTQYYNNKKIKEVLQPPNPTITAYMKKQVIA